MFPALGPQNRTIFVNHPKPNSTHEVEFKTAKFGWKLPNLATLHCKLSIYIRGVSLNIYRRLWVWFKVRTVAAT